MILKNCSYILTQDSNRCILRNYDILIEGNTIKKIGNNLKGDAKIDCRNKLVMPGLINTHTHFPMHSLRGICDNKELDGWIKDLSKFESKINENAAGKNTLEACKEAINFGTTTVADFYKFPEARKKAFEKAGLRAFVASTVRDKKDIPKSESFVKSCKNGLVKPMLSAHSVFECEKDLILKIRDLSEKYNLMRRIHVGETRLERYESFKKYQKLPVEFLAETGFLSDKSILVHCIWITKGEIRLIAEKDAKISHNPISNMKLASGGVMPLREILDNGITVGLGTDSVASNNNLDLFEEMKVCALLHRHHYWNADAVLNQKVLDMATVDAAKCLGLEDVGSIEEGKKADIITIDLKRPHLNPINDIVSNIIFSANGNDVVDVIVDGKVLK